MAPLYQLPCTSCDRVIQINVTQAGEELNCACGVHVLVPTMREIKSLPMVGSSAATPASKPARSPAQGACFAIGMLMLAGGIYAHFWLSAIRNEIDISRPEFVELDFDIQELSPYAAWRTWENFGQITRSTGELPYRQTPKFIAARAEYARLTRNRTAAWVVAAIGGAAIVATFVVQVSKKRLL